MNLREQIRQLKRQRAHELRTTGYLYARTRRDLMRSLSPDRFVRRHVGLTMGAAALAGMLLAPAPKYQKPEKTGGASRLGSLLARAIPPLKRYFPQAGEQPADKKEETGKEAPATSKAKEKLWGTIGQLAAEMLPFLLNRRVLNNILNRRAPITTESTVEPTVSVANAGATTADFPFDGHFSS